MPRKRRAARAYRQSATIAQKIAAFNPWSVFMLPPGEIYPAEFKTKAERRAYDRERERRYAIKQAAWEDMRRDRLREWPLFMWHELFSEMPGLEDELTDAQRDQWETWKEEDRRKKLRESLSNVRPMPPIEMPEKETDDGKK